MQRTDPNKISTVSAATLGPQLNSIGLTCDITKPQQLQPIIDNTEAHLPAVGQGEFFAVHNTDVLMAALKKGSPTAFQDSQDATSPWEPSATALGYSADLALISAHFDDLKANYTGFVGYKGAEPTARGQFASVDAIRNLFVQVALNSSASVVTGIDKVSLNVVLSNAISPLQDSTDNYDKTDSRFCCLLLNYNPATGDADGVGFVSLQWRLQISDYKRKTKNGGDTHNTILDITAWSCVYDNIDVLNAQVAWVKQRVPKLYALIKSIPPKYQFKVFNELPPASEEAFESGLPLESTVAQLSSIVLYSADLASLGCLTNTSSSASSSYSIATTSGFTYEMTQKIGSEVSMEAGVIFAKASVKISLELSFTEQWNRSQTETITFEVPAGQQAFIYKGILRSRIITFDPQTNAYTWGATGTFYTNNIVSSKVPLTGDPAYTVSRPPPITPKTVRKDHL